MEKTEKRFCARVRILENYKWIEYLYYSETEDGAIKAAFTAKKVNIGDWIMVGKENEKEQKRRITHKRIYGHVKPKYWGMYSQFDATGNKPR